MIRIKWPVALATLFLVLLGWYVIYPQTIRDELLQVVEDPLPVSHSMLPPRKAVEEVQWAACRAFGTGTGMPRPQLLGGATTP